MSEHGGSRKGAGRKPIAEEDKAKDRLLKALKLVYKKEEEESVIKFLEEYVKTKDGMNFFAAHIIGKPKDKLEHSGEGITAIVNLGTGINPDETTK